MSRDYALKSDTPSRGATNTGITLGAVALGLALLGNGNGGLPALFGGGHGHGHGHSNDRIARLEAGQAALAVEVKMNSDFDKERAVYEERLTDAKIREATCRLIPGDLYMPPTRLADNYRSEPRYIDSHTHHRGCGRGWSEGAGGSGQDSQGA